ncbi:MAG TPA: acyl-CoA dehydrogenase family protein [Chloroflexota bacterium]|nr:acyl-CoA dehydrogenase family protein [Chloroflexota bacterium]
MRQLNEDATRLIEAAKELAPLIREQRAAIEENRQLPPSLVGAMVDAGLFRMYVPRQLGGLEVHPVTFSRVVEEISRIDGATGWNLTVGAVYGALAAFLRDDVAREIYGSPPEAIVAGTINPTGRADAVDGGFRVTGRWAFGSGIKQASWITGNCFVYDGNERRIGASGAPELRIVFFRADACQIHDTWKVGGLRGTGSHDFSVTDLFVPVERSLIAFTAPSFQPGALYACPFITIFAATIAAPALGMARGAIDCLKELAVAKTPTGSTGLLRDRASVQSDVARAEALLLSAQAFLYNALDDLMDATAAGREVTMEERAMVRLASAHAGISSAQAVDLMYNAGGASSIYESSPLERFFRDVHAATQHIAVLANNYELTGRVLLGLPPGTARF